MVPLLRDVGVVADDVDTEPVGGRVGYRQPNGAETDHAKCFLAEFSDRRPGPLLLAGPH